MIKSDSSGKLIRIISLAIVFLFIVSSLFTIYIIESQINSEDVSIKTSLSSIKAKSTDKLALKNNDVLKVLLKNDITSKTNEEEKVEETEILNEEITEVEQIDNQEERNISNIEEISGNEPVVITNESNYIPKTKIDVETEFEGYQTIGKIEIPATGVDTPILSNVTVPGMRVAPCLLYSTGELNKSGNNYIVGHNYQNDTLFSNNEKLQIGDKIYVTSLDGEKVEYTIYSKFMTTPEDISYLQRDTSNSTEITLQCCSNDEEERIIILAKQ